MGRDAVLHFSTKEKLTTAKKIYLESQLNDIFNDMSHSNIEYQELASGVIYDRLYGYDPEPEHVYSLWIPWRHFPGVSHYRIWVKIYGYIRYLQSHKFVEKVYYGSDEDNILNEVCEEKINENWTLLANEEPEDGKSWWPLKRKL